MNWIGKTCGRKTWVRNRAVDGVHHSKIRIFTVVDLEKVGAAVAQVTESF
jgi:hypothetical protein